MVVTVQYSIPQNARGFFLREREALNEQFNVQLKFPKGKEFLHGTNQMMLMVGRQSNITTMMPHIRRILYEANKQYQEFKQRQAYRKVKQARERDSNAWVFIKSNKANTKKDQTPKKPRNAFAILDGLFEQEQEQLKIQRNLQEEADRKQAIIDAQLQKEQNAIDSGLAPKSVQSQKCAMNFVAAIKKPAVPKETTIVYNKIENKNEFSWDDKQSDDESEEEEDNGWEPGMSWGDIC